MKKFLCGMMICFSFLLTACGRENIPEPNNLSSGGKVSDSIPQKREWVYVPEVFTVEGYADYERMQPVGDSFFYVSREGDTGNSVSDICRYSLADDKTTRIPMRAPDEWSDWDVGYCFFSQDYGLSMTANVYSSGFRSMQRFLCRLDSEGNCLFARDITEKAGINVSICELTVDRQGRFYIFLDNGEILLCAEDGNYYDHVSYRAQDEQETVWIKGACEGADGKVSFCSCKENRNAPDKWKEETAKGKCTLQEIDFENATLREIAGNLPNINGICAVNNICAETGINSDSGEGYDLFLYDEKAVYGYCFDAQKEDSESAGEGNFKELFRWLDSDINGYCVTNLYLLEDGRLCATFVDWQNDDGGIVALERKKAEEAPQREELVLATVDGGRDLAAMAVKFNRGSSRYHLTVQYYESLTDLYNAMLTNKSMDLIDLSGINVQRLIDKGLVEDLTPYVDQSEVFERTDFLDGLLDVYRYDDTLAGIPAEFMIQTVVGDVQRMDNKSGLTLEELYRMETRFPGAKAFDGVTREEVLQYLMMFNEDSFIDWENKTCHFDSKEFKAMLEYVKPFPDALSDGKEEEPLSEKIKRGEVLFAVAHLYPPFILRSYKKMFGEGAVCVGFPTEDGGGGHLLIGSETYAIAAVSEKKQAAWSFIEDVLTEEDSAFSTMNHIWETYPAMKDKLNKRAQAAIERKELAWEDVEVVLELIPDATPAYSVQDDVIIKIINEEAPAYYSGQKGINDVVGIIQNRIQLYVDENGE